MSSSFFGCSVAFSAGAGAATGVDAGASSAFGVGSGFFPITDSMCDFEALTSFGFVALGSACGKPEPWLVSEEAGAVVLALTQLARASLFVWRIVAIQRRLIE